jgi:hypothetical protein
MAQPIYKLFMGRFSEAWYRLSEEEQKSLIAKLDEALETVGVRGRFYATRVGPRINGWLLEWRSSRTSRRSRTTWRPLTS